jgi:hypothetical protein
LKDVPVLMTVSHLLSYSTSRARDGDGSGVVANAGCLDVVRKSQSTSPRRRRAVIRPTIRHEEQRAIHAFSPKVGRLDAPCVSYCALNSEGVERGQTGRRLEHVGFSPLRGVANTWGAKFSMLPDNSVQAGAAQPNASPCPFLSLQASP